MSQLLETEIRRGRKRPAPLMPGGDSNRSIPIGIIATILLHLVIYLGTPQTFQRAPAQGSDKYSDEMEFQLTPEEPPPEPFKFVETNPDKPDNPPDKTENFAAQNQQAAQEKPTQDNNDMPTTEGRDMPSVAIVTGQKAEPVESANPGRETPPTPEVAEIQNQARPEALTPLPGFEKVEGDDEEGIGTNVSEVAPRPRPIEKRVEGEETPSKDEIVVAIPPSTPGRPSPQPRPRLQNTRPAPLANQPHGVSRAGQIGVDAQFSEFGDYLQELIEIVQNQWNLVLDQTATRPPNGSKVIIRFTLSSEGQVTRIEEVEETAGKPGTYACLNAIQARQPYRPWTKEMVAILGTEQVITFGFYYW